MCRIYAAPPDLTEALMGLARETKAKGRWHAYGDVIPEGYDVYIGLEEAASQLAAYQPELVPGLLQTEQYARFVIQADNTGVDAGKIDRRVHAGSPGRRWSGGERAAAADRSPERGHLARPVGGTGVMAAQLDSLAAGPACPTWHCGSCRSPPGCTTASCRASSSSCGSR